MVSEMSGEAQEFLKELNAIIIGQIVVYLLMGLVFWYHLTSVWSIGEIAVREAKNPGNSF